MPAPLILVVDDDQNILAFLQTALRDEGYNVVLSGGAASLQVARVQHPSMILLDLMMPGMDGQEVSRRLRADPSTADIPIVMMSAVATRRTMSDLPVNDCLAKPFDLDQLYSAVEHWAC